MSRRVNELVNIGGAFAVAVGGAANLGVGRESLVEQTADACPRSLPPDVDFSTRFRFSPAF